MICGASYNKLSKILDVPVTLQSKITTNRLTIPVSPPLIVNSKLQYFSAKPRRLMIIAVSAPAAPEKQKKTALICFVNLDSKPKENETMIRMASLAHLQGQC